MNQTDKQVTAVEQGVARATMRSGFTLMEILVAVAIIGILGTVAVQQVTGNIERAKLTAAKESVDNLANAVTSYYLANKKYPNDLKDLIKENSDGEAIVSGGEGALEDPWGTEFKFEKKGKKYVVISAGPDMEFGGEDDIRSDQTKKSKKD